MNSKTIFGALSALALTLAVAAPALAQTPPCQADVKAVQAEWDKMTPMGMGNAREGASRTVIDSLRLAKEACQAGNPVGAQTYLNVVRAHLNLPQHPAPHDIKG